MAVSRYGVTSYLHMTMKSAWVVASILVIGIAGYVLLFKNSAPPADMTPPAAQTDSVASGNDDATFTVITLTDAGFSPANATVAVGDTVRFMNESSRGMWIGSDDHPTHTNYDGTSMREHCADDAATNGTFDQCSAAAAGQHWDYTFEKAGTFGFHNHVGISNTGTVVVN